MIDSLGGENIRITGAFFGNAGNFQGYGVGQARYGDRYVGRNCYIDDSYLGGKATTIVDFTSRSLDLMFLCFFFVCVCVCVCVCALFCVIFSSRTFAPSHGGLDTSIVKLDALVCKTAPGIGTLYAWQIRHGQEAWPKNDLNAAVMSYYPPKITNMDSSQWPFQATEGGNLISIEGRYFGPPSSERGLGGIGNVVYGNSKQFELASRSFPEGQRWMT